MWNAQLACYETVRPRVDVCNNVPWDGRSRFLASRSPYASLSARLDVSFITCCSIDRSALSRARVKRFACGRGQGGRGGVHSRFALNSEMPPAFRIPPTGLQKTEVDVPSQPMVFRFVTTSAMACCALPYSMDVFS